MQRRNVSKSLLGKLLLLSLASNLILVALFAFAVSKRTFPEARYPPSLEEVTGNVPLPEKIESASFAELVEMLLDPVTLIARKRACDLAFLTLVERFDFDWKRATSSGKLPLSDEERLLLYQFAKREVWPIGPRGLFEKLKEGNRDPALLRLFFQSEPFLLVETLLQRQKLPIQRGQLLTLLLDGKWELLEQFCKAQEKGANWSQNRAFSFLLEYVQERSEMAAYLLVLHDPDKLLSSLDDSTLTKVLCLLNAPTVESKKFMHRLLQSDRAEPIKRLAGQRVCDFSGGNEVALERPGIGQLRPLFREQIPRSPSPREHVVQDGESLWLIAKRYHVELDALIQANHLQSTTIRRGQVLKLPQ